MVNKASTGDGGETTLTGSEVESVQSGPISYTCTLDPPPFNYPVQVVTLSSILREIAYKVSQWRWEGSDNSRCIVFPDGSSIGTRNRPWSRHSKATLQMDFSIKEFSCLTPRFAGWLYASLHSRCYINPLGPESRSIGT